MQVYSFFKLKPIILFKGLHLNQSSSGVELAFVVLIVIDDRKVSISGSMQGYNRDCDWAEKYQISHKIENWSNYNQKINFIYLSYYRIVICNFFTFWVHQFKI